MQVAIRKQGYPFRLPHEDFVARYKKICESDIDESTSPRDAAMQIVKVRCHPRLSLDDVHLLISESGLGNS